MEYRDVQAWIEGYVQAWNTNDPEDIGRIFAPEAQYYTAPYRQPWAGREQIILGWLGRKDDPGTFEFRYQILGVDQKTGFVRGWTKYFSPPKQYSNLWVVRLNEQGQCEEFVEWWMEEDQG